MSRLAQETYPNVSSSLPGDMRKPAALAFAAQCCDPGCKPKWTTWTMPVAVHRRRLGTAPPPSGIKPPSAKQPKGQTETARPNGGA